MEKKYVVKDFETQTYYCDEFGRCGWSKKAYFAKYFETPEDAEDFIKYEEGKLQIEVVYVV